MIKSVFEDGYHWVEFPEGAWERAQFTMYYEGYPLSIKIHA